MLLWDFFFCYSNSHRKMTLLLKYNAITSEEESERVKGIVVMVFISTHKAVAVLSLCCQTSDWGNWESWSLTLWIIKCE